MMSKPTCYRKVKAYKAPKISEPSSQEKMLARCLTLLNEELKGLGYKYVAGQNNQLRLVLANDLINNSSFWEAANRLKLDEQRTRTSASPDCEKTEDDPFFKALAKVNAYSTYGMHTVYEPKQLTIDDMLKENK